jgi:photosystem II stability/assembly factor-like uncharacterized protein
MSLGPVANACRLAAMLLWVGLAAGGRLAAAVPAWVPIGPASGAPRVLSVVFDPLHPGVVYAGLDGGGVVRSDDGGVSWRLASRGLSGIFYDGTVVSHLLVSRQGHVFALGEISVFESADGAASWQEVNLPPQATLDGSSAGFAIDPLDPDTFYTTGLGLYRSTDHGASWSPLGGRLTATDCFGVAVDPLSRRQIYVGLHNARYHAGLYISRDGGASFARASPQVPLSIVVSPADPRTVWGVHRLDVVVSRDRGNHWSSVLYTGDEGQQATLLADEADAATAYLGAASISPGLGGAALVKTTDGGGHWQALTGGLPATLSVLGLAQDPFAPAVLLAATDQGLFRSADAGASWAPTGADIVDTAVSALAAAPDGTLFAAAGAALWRWAPQAAGWQEVFRLSGYPAFVTPIPAVSLAPDDPRTVYVAAGVVTAGQTAVLWRSRDGGDSWAPLTVPPDHLGSTPGPTDLAIDPHQTLTLYLARGSDLLKSTDGGATWAVLPAIAATELALDPSADPAILYAAGGASIGRSTDGGATWSAVLISPGAFASHVAVAPSAPQVVYAVLESDGNTIYRSADHGATWQPFAAPLGFLYSPLDSVSHHPLAVDPVDSDVLYAGWTFGVTRSVHGAPWRLLTDGIVADPVTTLLFAPGGLLFAGTQAAGAFALPLGAAAAPPAR